MQTRVTADMCDELTTILNGQLESQSEFRCEVRFAMFYSDAQSDAHKQSAGRGSLARSNSSSDSCGDYAARGFHRLQQRRFTEWNGSRSWWECW